MSEDTSQQPAGDDSSPQAQGSPGPRILRWFSNPWVGVIGAITSCLGLVATIFFYFAADRTRKLVFYPHPVKTTVAKAGASSGLRIFYGDRKIDTDVTAAQVALWNSGRASIRPENILRQIKIVTRPPVPILEATVRRVTREVIGLKLDDSGFSHGVVLVNWRILEFADGGAIQIIYAGSQQVELAVDGIIEGQPRIINVRYPGEIKDPTAQVETLLLPTWFRWLGIALFVVATQTVFPLIFRATEKLRKKYPWRGFFVFSISALVLTLAVILVGLRLLLPVFALPNPPFSF